MMANNGLRLTMDTLMNKKKENLPLDKTELEVLKYLNQINFGTALENYQEFIND